MEAWIEWKNCHFSGTANRDSDLFAKTKHWTLAKYKCIYNLYDVFWSKTVVQQMCTVRSNTLLPG